MPERQAPAGAVDRFGNPIDGSVGYARGRILGSGADEIARTMYARGLIRHRMMSLGEDSVFDLSGLPRSYPLLPEDLAGLKSQAAFYANFAGTGEDLAVRFMGGDPTRHDALFLNRVSSGLLAVALALLQRGDTVVSLVPRGRSHPPVQLSVEAAGGYLVDVEGIAEFEAAVGRLHPRMVVVTPVTSAKHHLPVEDLLRAAELARSAGSVVFLDDAHMASRLALYDDPPPFRCDAVDLGIFSTDKHIDGPRAGVLVGVRPLVERIRTVAVQFGLEAQSGHYLAAARALQRHRVEPLKRAGELAAELLARLERRYGDMHFYSAGSGVAISGEEALAIAMERTGKTVPAITPVEAVSVVCNQMLREHGLLTISSLSMPGSAAVVRVIMFPDGARAGVDRVLVALESGLATLGDVLDCLEASREVVLGR